MSRRAPSCAPSSRSSGAGASSRISSEGYTRAENHKKEGGRNGARRFSTLAPHFLRRPSAPLRD
jgi:hypothetical protein